MRTTATLSIILFCSVNLVFGQHELFFEEFTNSSSVKIQLANEAKALDHCMNARDKFIKQDYTNAIKYCTKAIEINPNSSAAYRLRGYSQILLGSVEKGCVDLKKASLLGERRIDE
jgi:tetratricopeptide (TPR) repeat protein